MPRTTTHLIAASLFAMASIGVAPVWAANSAVAYSHMDELTLTGTIDAFEYMNPHSALHMTVANRNGQTEKWTIETESPLILQKAGIEKMALTAGDKITARVHPAKDKPMTAWLIELKKSDGTVLTIPEPYQESPPTSATPRPKG